jgi:hypothetical protein
MGILPGKDAHLDAFASLTFAICLLPACLRYAQRSPSHFRNGPTLLWESPSLLFASRKPAPSGAQVEGLIQAARCRLRSLTALLAPTGSGLSWPGGLDSPITSSNQLRSSKHARSIRAHPDPGGGIYFFSNASRCCCQDILLIFSTPIFVASSPLQTTATKPLDSPAVSWVVSCLCM